MVKINYNESYNKYLGQLAILNKLRYSNFVSEKEYISMKDFLIKKYKVRDTLIA